ncbi:hypothetical protein J6590_071223 [Homalodisca vitripennis]|nr:hypothetical protein J6590_071223 [Homalodisca vitripennis]
MDHLQYLYMAKIVRYCTVTVGPDKLGVADAVICFNDGSVGKPNVLKRLTINPGKFTVLGLKRIDLERIRKAEREVEEENKNKRVLRRKLKENRKIKMKKVTVQVTFSEKNLYVTLKCFFPKPVFFLV